MALMAQVATLIVQSPPTITILKGNNFEEALRELNNLYIPHRVTTVADNEFPLPSAQNREQKSNKTTFYICQGNSCLTPETDIQKVKLLLK